MPPTDSYKTVQSHSRNSHNFYTNKMYVFEPVQRNQTQIIRQNFDPIQPNPWMDPTNVHLWVGWPMENSSA